MLNTFPIALLISTALGIIAGMGIGGGSLLVLWLSAFTAFSHTDIRILNLLFFLPAAAISSIINWRKGELNIRKMIPAIIGGCISAAICSFISQRLDTGILKTLFGILLLITGLRELFYRPRKAK